ncbi:MAG: hypothetical protein KGZ83_01795 [Sulfuricella sp.]|nr:hypothetical protein [Sulfuricella sp.]
MPNGAPTLFLAALLTLPSSAVAQIPGYTLTDLGLLADSNACSAAGLNGKGQVVGFCVSVKELPGKFSSTEAFVYGDGAMTGLGRLPGNDSSNARAIGDNGWIIGQSFNAPSSATGAMAPVQAFLYRDKRIGTLNGLNGDSQILTGIGAAGQIIGFSNSASGRVAGFLYADGAVMPLDFIPSAINRNGQIIGRNINQANNRFSWYDQGRTTLLDIPAGTFAQPPSAVNDQGWSVGATTISYGPALGDSPYGALSQDSAYLYAQGKVTYLGFLPGYNQSSPRAINTQGVIVGVSGYLGAAPPECSGDAGGDVVAYLTRCRPTLSKPSRAFLYAEGRMTDLNALLPPEQAAQYLLSEASAINDAGQIAATAIVDGQNRAVLLTPVSGGAQNPTPGRTGDLVAFQASLRDDGSDGNLRAGFEPGPVAGKNGQIFVMALVPTAQGGGIYFMDEKGRWHPYSDCATAPAYTPSGPLGALPDIPVLGASAVVQLRRSAVTLYLGYGLADAAAPDGSACRDMVKFKNYMPLTTL